MFGQSAKRWMRGAVAPSPARLRSSDGTTVAAETPATGKPPSLDGSRVKLRFEGKGKDGNHFRQQRQGRLPAPAHRLRQTVPGHTHRLPLLQCRSAGCEQEDAWTSRGCATSPRCSGAGAQLPGRRLRQDRGGAAKVTVPANLKQGELDNQLDFGEQPGIWQLSEAVTLASGYTARTSPTTRRSLVVQGGRDYLIATPPTSRSRSATLSIDPLPLRPPSAAWPAPSPSPALPVTSPCPSTAAPCRGRGQAGHGMPSTVASSAHPRRAGRRHRDRRRQLFALLRPCLPLHRGCGRAEADSGHLHRPEGLGEGRRHLHPGPRWRPPLCRRAPGGLAQLADGGRTESTSAGAGGVAGRHGGQWRR